MLNQNKKFGIWEIDREYGLTGKVTHTFEFPIAKHDLWQTITWDEQPVWRWLIHLAEKTWITRNNFKDLVDAFTYAQDIFKDKKPHDAKEASTARTIEIAEGLIGK